MAKRLVDNDNMKFDQLMDFYRDEIRDRLKRKNLTVKELNKLISI